jgi:hypothetical protein
MQCAWTSIRYQFASHLLSGSYRGSMAAATDTLGRVMLLDAAIMAVICLWKVITFCDRLTHLSSGIQGRCHTKGTWFSIHAMYTLQLQGYRDAQCAWLTLSKPHGMGDAVLPASDAAADEADPSSPAATRSAKRAKQDLPSEPAETQVL